MTTHRLDPPYDQRRPLGLALALVTTLLAGAAGAAGAAEDAAAADAPDSITVEVASSRPPCEPHGRPGSMSELEWEALEESYRRCYGTRSDDYRLQLAPGKRVALYASEPAPHAFIRLRRLWVDTEFADRPVLVFELVEGDAGHLLQASAEGRQWQVPLFPGRWMELAMSPYGNLWVKEIAESGTADSESPSPAAPGR